MATGRVSEFCPTGQGVDSTGVVPGERDTLGFRGVIGLCCHSAREPAGMRAVVSDGALEPERDTWAACHGHKHRQCDT